MANKTNIRYSMPRIAGTVTVDLEAFRGNPLETHDQLVRNAMIEVLKSYLPVADIEVSD